MNRTVRTALFCLVALGGVVRPVLAQDACAPDRERLCKEAKGPHAKPACMKAHEAELSEACKAQRGMVKQAAAEVHNDCKADAARLCQGVKHGEGRIRACLTSHAAELSPACKRAEDNLTALKEAIHPGCHSDVARLCQGVPKGQGRILACLQTHPNELSPACKANVDMRLAKHAGAPSASPPPPVSPPPSVSPPPAAQPQIK